MLNMYAQEPARKSMSALAVVVASMAWMAAADAAECPRQGTLGTSRVLAVDAATAPRVGLKSFPRTLPLDDHEVVLTFDDGPWPATTPLVLAALARECRTPGPDAQDRSRGPYRWTSHLAASQPQANDAGRGHRGDRPRHRRG
jgi:hypothetical protein